MPTDLDAGALSPGDLDCRIPADPAAVLAFHGLVTGEVRFLIDRNRVDVGGRVFLRKLDSLTACLIEHVQQDVACTWAALFFDQATQ